MDDTEYFAKYKDSFEMVFTSHTSDRALLKDIELKYHSITNNMVKFLGISSAKEMTGKTLAEFASTTNFCEKKQVGLLTRQDQQVLDTKKSKIYLQIFSFNNENKILIHYKTPIINSNTGNAVGIRCLIAPLIWPHAVKTLFKMHGTKGLLIGSKQNNSNPFDEFPLNSAQHMVLFLALNNYSYSEISMLLSEFGHQVTPIRVNDYLEQLKNIFHVRNKSQLVEKAVGLSLHTYLPKGLFSKLSSIEISKDEASIFYSDYANK